MSTPTIDSAASPQPKTERAERRVQGGLLDPQMLWKSMPGALRKLDPRTLWRNPVMFIVEIGAVWSTILAIVEPSWFAWLIVVWLWLTVIFANLAEAVAEGRGKAQAESLRRTKTATMARRLVGWQPGAPGREEEVAAPLLQQGDIVVVEAGQAIPGDGDVVEGIASVDESAITGESAPVIRESGGDRSAVTGGTTVLSDRIVVQDHAEAGRELHRPDDRARRGRQPAEDAERDRAEHPARGVDDHLRVRGRDAAAAGDLLQDEQPRRPGQPGAHVNGVTGIVMVSLLVCLIPTTIGALLSAIGIAGMDRLVQRNVLAMSGRAVEAAGDVNTLLLDKTGTITLGNRQAAAFMPLDGVTARGAGRCRAAVQPRRRDSRRPFHRRVRQTGVRPARHGRQANSPMPTGSNSVPPQGCPASISTTTSCARARPSSVADWVRNQGGEVPTQLGDIVDGISAAGGTPLVVGKVQNGKAAVLGVIHLKDVVKQGMRERFDEMRRMGIRTVMITGDNPLTAKAIADEAGVDDFLAEATPEDKMALIKTEQAGGKLVAMTGDGTNDAPALAQADVGVAMNTGTSAAKEAGNMVDLDSDPTKLIEIVEIGKQLLITRGALTTFSIANDIAKYFAIIPAMFVALFPGLDLLNIMRLHSPQSAILSAVIFNAIIIVALIPLSLRGVRYTPSSASKLLSRNLYVYGLGGIIAPFIGIKLIDLVIQLFPGM